MAEEKKDINEVKAFARGIHVSPRKARLLVSLVKSLPVGEALTQLEFTTKKAARPLKKLINSAVANASHNFQIESNRLFVKNLRVDGGQVFLRYEPRAQGRAFPVRKRTSHISLILGVRKQPFRLKKKLIPPKREVKSLEEKSAPLVQRPAEEEKKSRFAFWKNWRLPRGKAGKRARDTTQLPPKEDVKGKRYTGFDRRGNMGA